MNTDYTIKQAVKEAYKRSLDYRGRSTRAAFWKFQLAIILSALLLYLSLILAFIIFFVILAIAPQLNDVIKNADRDSLLLLRGGYTFLVIASWFIFIIFMNIPLICRRLADSGKSPLFVFLLAIPCIGLLTIFILCCSDSERGSNKWGVSLKYPDKKQIKSA